MRIFCYLLGNYTGVKKCAAAPVLLCGLVAPESLRYGLVRFRNVVDIPSLLLDHGSCPGLLNASRQLLLPLVVVECFPLRFPVRDEVCQLKRRDLRLQVYAPLRGSPDELWIRLPVVVHLEFPKLTHSTWSNVAVQHCIVRIRIWFAATSRVIHR